MPFLLKTEPDKYSYDDLLRDGRLPPQRWDGLADPELPALRFTEVGARLPDGQPHRLMSSSFAFGGNNACLILGDAA